MGSADDRKQFVTMVNKACRIGKRLRELGVRSSGVIRIDSAAGLADWAKDPVGNTKPIAQTFREACDVAEDHGERLAAEGEICWGGMHGWKAMLDTLEQTSGPIMPTRMEQGSSHPPTTLKPSTPRAAAKPSMRVSLRPLSTRWTPRQLCGLLRLRRVWWRPGWAPMPASCPSRRRFKP